MRKYLVIDSNEYEDDTEENGEYIAHNEFLINVNNRNDAIDFTKAFKEDVPDGSLIELFEIDAIGQHVKVEV